MANYGPQSAWLLVGGNDVTGDVYDLGDSVEQVLEEVHPFMGGSAVSYDIYLPVGVAKCVLETGQGIYDTRTAGMLDAFQEAGQTRQLVGWGIEGLDIASRCKMVDGTYAVGWTRKAQRGNITMGQAKHVLTGAVSPGFVVSDDTSRGADGNTQSTPVDKADVLGEFTNSVDITSSSAATNRILCATTHGIHTYDAVLIGGHSGSTPDINGYHVIEKIDGDEFKLLTSPTGSALDITVGGTGGWVQEVTLDAAITITSSEADDDKFLCASAHGLAIGDLVKITNHSSDPDPRYALWRVTWVDSDQFTVSSLAGVAFDITTDGADGTVQKVLDTLTIDLHVPALTLGGATDVTVTPQSSVDGTNWTDLTAFTAVTAAGSSERKTYTTQAARYLAIKWAWTGGPGTFTPVVLAAWS